VYCRSCSYDLSGLPSGACPECGKAFDPADPASYEALPRSRRRLRQSAFAIGAATVIGLVAYFGFRIASGRTFGSYQAAFLTYIAIGLPLGVTAGALAGRKQWWPGRLVLLIVGILCLWLTLLLGVAEGFRAWQSMPDPPPEAFADGAKALAALLLGWFPAAIVVAISFATSALVSWMLGRRATPTSTAG
jgi:hypothetical protein